jgi:hypothetical protein
MNSSGLGYVVSSELKQSATQSSTAWSSETEDLFLHRVFNSSCLYNVEVHIPDSYLLQQFFKPSEQCLNISIHKYSMIPIHMQSSTAWDSNLGTSKIRE